MQLDRYVLAMVAGAVMVMTGVRGRLGDSPGGSATRAFDIIMLLGGAALLLWGFRKR
jgi:hypothetical protein